MHKNTKVYFTVITLALTTALAFSGCTSNKLGEQQNASTLQNTAQSSNQASTNSQSASTGAADNSSTAQTQEGTDNQSSTGQTGSRLNDADLTALKPDESGKITVVMFHNFIAEFKKGDKQYTTTFDNFRALLGQLYDSGYRLISLSDYLDNNIKVPAGYIPMVFTFDDGTAGQFNLVDNNGKLTANKDSAVGIMEEFNKAHPDFGLKGTFYVNLGNGNTFGGTGTLAQRLKYLIDEGFEIGNHTYDHINLKKTKTADEVQMEIGKNQQKMYELVPGYTMKTFSLPFGLPSKDLQQYVIKGEYQGVSYENHAIMEVGWDPAPSPVSPKFDPMSTHRVRASGIEPVDDDLAWWLKNLSRSKQYVSDGNPDTITVPKGNEKNVDTTKLNGKKLITY